MNLDEFMDELQDIRDELAVMPTLMRIGSAEAERHTTRRRSELERHLRDLGQILDLHSLGEADDRLRAQITALGLVLTNLGDPGLAYGWIMPQPSQGMH